MMQNWKPLWKAGKGRTCPAFVELFPDRPKGFQKTIHWRSDWNEAADSITPYPFAIFQLAIGGIPCWAMARKLSADLVENKRFRLENTSVEWDFLDFHASPFALTSLMANFLVGNVPCHWWSMNSTQRRGWMRFSIFTTGGSNLIGLMYGNVVMLLGVRFGCCGGKSGKGGYRKR